ncbi:MAG: glycosyltransferase family 39 protein [Candidatus Omnitrophica bacterium]|nr:glycosyltransferase family 39 protein [Candidatus Omnitrophota bacterium]MBU4590162.1 glycosyltransferase family 39 protein [Candidatus Omnitrophota bacterium]
MIGNRYKVYWKKGWISALIILGAFTYLLNISWLKWGSLLIDTGRELCVPWRLLSGDLLYKDIFYEFGPFAPYLNALLCMIFGVHLRSFIIGGILTVALMCFLIYKLSRIFLTPIFSTLSVLTFLFVFAFNQHYEAGIFNYIIPYSYASIYSMLFACAALFFYSRSLLKGKRGSIYLCGFLTLLTLVTRIEIGIMLIVSILTGIILDSRRGKRSKMICIYSLFPVIVAGLIYGLFAIMTRGAAHHIVDTNTLLINVDIRGPLTGNTLGTNDFWNNIAAILKTALYYTGISVVFFIAGWVLFLIRKLGLIKKGLLSIGAVALAVGIVILFQRKFFPYYLQYRCAPIICIVLFIIAYRGSSAGMDQKRSLFLMAFSVFSVLTMTRMLFAVKAEHSGFYLLVPGMLCYYFFFLKVIPEIFTKTQMRAFYGFAFAILSAAFIITPTTFSFYMYKYRTLEISSPRGTMRVRPGYYRCKQLLDYLNEKTGPSATLVVFPEGSTLNFLSARVNPLHQHSYLPLWFSDPDNEEEVINGLEDNDVTYVAIVRRDTSDYGAARFGIDYAQGIMSYLANHYVSEKQFGPWPFTSNEFSLVLLKRQ